MDLKNVPRITFIVCNYNYEKYVEESLLSAFNQNYPKEKLRVCVIDGGSKDSCVKIINEKFFKGIPHENTRTQNYQHKSCVYQGVKFDAFYMDDCDGPSRARNLGIEHTINDTDYFMILDADDVAYPNKCMRLLQEASQAPDIIGAVYADYHVQNIDTGVITYEYKRPYDKFVLNQECIVHSGSLVSKNAMMLAKDEFGFFDVNMRTCEDYELWMRISESFIFLHVAEPLSLVRVHQNNATHSVDKSVWQKNWVRVHEKRRRRAISEQVSN